MKAKFLIILGIVVFTSSLFTLSNADAAEFAVNINPQNSESRFTVKYHATINMEYDEGGKIKDILKDKNWTIRKTADPLTHDSIEIASRLNQKISQDGSNAKISDLSVVYQAELRGESNSASIDYLVVLTGTLSDYILSYPSDASRPVLIDMGWRGLSITGPVLVDGYDINLPISAIMEKEPELYSIMLPHPKVISSLSDNILDAEDILHTKLHDWHFLFDPTGLDSDASGIVITEYSLDANRLYGGNSVKSETSESFMADADYKVTTILPADSANIRIAGFAALDTLDEIEILGVRPLPPEGFAVTSTGDVPFAMVYGLPIIFTVAATIVGYLLFKKGTMFF
ncbi:hypothetical protein [Nitrosarchaeum sp. AC2]|uniref:hypothetical protein n=1 Tax=Nitrosarchaeum sp. AC2 TaxID=2259673 RepID=UPI0015C7C171|nr:hypothetical protein [Nitrosarchaeum sp. AC2]QLH10829.1 hypothetical protein DSQ20_04600 [Nitrosarchaeum sp. AC2]